MVQYPVTLPLPDEYFRLLLLVYSVMTAHNPARPVSVAYPCVTARFKLAIWFRSEVINNSMVS